MNTYVFSLKDESIDTCIIGGKACSLAKMMKLGLPVPEGYVITAKAFVQKTVENSEDKSVKFGLCAEAEEELGKLVTSLPNKYTYAVRSSALNEDGDLASFAGAYETLTDVTVDNIAAAVETIVASADAARVEEYTQNIFNKEVAKMDENEYSENNQNCGSQIAVVIQRFVRPIYAGVLFTANPVTGSAAQMQGNYVCGEGELLVSGNANAEEFTFNAFKYDYQGNAQFEPYAKKLYKYAVTIRKHYQLPMDIEWAVSEGKLYVLQARPITTLRRLRWDTYEVNGSLAGEYMLSKTNVGEIFTVAVSPMTFSVLEEICKMLGVPCFIDNVCGQAYANISVVCSLLQSFGFSKKKSYSMIADLAGTIPEGMEIPVFPFDKKSFLKAVKSMLFSRKKKKYFRISNREFALTMGDTAREMIQEINAIKTSEELLGYWEKCDEFMARVMGAIVTSIKTKELLSTRDKLTTLAGEELANALCEGCGEDFVLESMKPLLYLEKVISKEMSCEEYRNKYGHRCASEMELATPYPYENPEFPKQLIAEHEKQGISVMKMQEEHRKAFEEAFAEFCQRFPKKEKWLKKKLLKYSAANRGREEIRSRGVWLFCMIREFLLKIGELEGIGDDVFMLNFSEALNLLKGNKEVLARIASRRQNYEKYLAYPTFPNLICARFEPEQWMVDENRRLDVFSASGNFCGSSDVKGYAGAAGVVEGRVRIILKLEDAKNLQVGEILVTTATNIGWTMYFPRAKAIVTDIGAPLSHAAIVAREFGIPAVVGCQNATTLLHTGDLVRVNGGAGTVEIIESKG